MDDPFLETLAVDWRETGETESHAVMARILRKRLRMEFHASLAVGGGAFLLVLAIIFALWAIQSHSYLAGIGSVAFVAGAPILFGAWSSTRQLLAVHHDVPPQVHLGVLQSLLDSDRRRLWEARGCSVILALASISAFALIMTGGESARAIIPAGAWAVTAVGVEIYRARLVRSLKRDQAAINALAK